MYTSIRRFEGGEHSDDLHKLLTCPPLGSLAVAASREPVALRLQLRLLYNSLLPYDRMSLIRRGKHSLGFSALDMSKSTEGLSKPHFCPRMAKELPGVLSPQPQQAPLLALGYSDE